MCNASGFGLDRRFAQGDRAFTEINRMQPCCQASATRRGAGGISQDPFQTRDVTLVPKEFPLPSDLLDSFPDAEWQHI